MKQKFLGFAVLLQCMFISLFAQQVNYVADSTFSSNGQLTFNFYNNIDRAFGSALQPDNKLVVVGLSKNAQSGFFELCFVRLNDDGSNDMLFGTNGVQKVSLGNQGSIGGMTPVVRIANDGKIVACNSGRSAAGTSQDMMVCRLDTNGVLDNTFGNNGVAFIDVMGTGSQPDLASDFIIDPTNNIYIVGACRTGFSPLDNDIAMAKLNSNGQLDVSFNSTGTKLFNPTGMAEFARAVRLRNDGKIAVGAAAGNNMMVMVMDTTGTLDNSFGTAGVFSVSFASGFPSFYTMQLYSDNRLLIGGNVSAANEDMALARILPNGTLDPTFGVGGKQTYNLKNTHEALTTIIIGSDEKIWLGGSVQNTTTNFDFMAARLDSTGTLDTDFNATGYVSYNAAISNAPDLCNSLILMPDSKLFFVGIIEISAAVNEDIGMVRLKPEAPVTSAIAENQNIMFPYPNPCQQILMIKSNVTDVVQIINAQGNVCRNVPLAKGVNTINTHTLPDGLYFVNGPKTKLTFIKN